MVVSKCLILLKLTIGKSSLHNGANLCDSDIDALNWHIGKPEIKMVYYLYANPIYL